MLRGKSSKSWREKLEKPMDPKLVDVPEKWAKVIGHGKMLIPTPQIVAFVINKIPSKKIATVNTIRDYLAKKIGAAITCPLTTGIFLNIVANAAEEGKQSGKIKITPYWRVLKEGGFLNPKFPGGTINQATYLKKEGFEIIEGKTDAKTYVQDYKQKLVKLN